MDRVPTATLESNLTVDLQVQLGICPWDSGSSIHMEQAMREGKVKEDFNIVINIACVGITLEGKKKTTQRSYTKPASEVKTILFSLIL